jgi:hypothetical protein
VRNFDLVDFVRESNRIESIHREPTEPEIQVHQDLIELSLVTPGDLEKFVSIVQPGAVLRDRVGLDVRVGQHCPPRGGPRVANELAELLVQAATCRAVTPRSIHVWYETLHPFTDGNGRSGRALWAWQMLREQRWPGIRLGFLHAYYYQTLEESP